MSTWTNLPIFEVERVKYNPTPSIKASMKLLQLLKINDNDWRKIFKPEKVGELDFFFKTCKVDGLNLKFCKSTRTNMIF